MMFRDYTIDEEEMYASYSIQNSNERRFENNLKKLNYFNFLVIADIGGFLGLFLGCSVLSIIEIFFFSGNMISAIVVNFWRRLRNKRRVQHLNQNIIHVR